MNPAIPKMTHRKGISGDSGGGTGGRVVVVVTGFLGTGVRVARVVALVVDSDFICGLSEINEVTVWIVVGTPAPLPVTAK